MTADNAVGWERLADAYQAEVGWPDDVLTWGLRCPTEDELGLVTDVVRDARTLVVGCGGGQDVVALARLGAGPLTGIDIAPAQVAHAERRLAAAGVDATLLVGDATDLTAVPAASVDLVVSVQALDYVEDIARCFAEIRRVLVPGGVLAFSVLHPADLATADRPPFAWTGSYFTARRDWVWDGLAEDDVPFTSWHRSPGAWFTAATAAGLTVERLEEPAPTGDTTWRERGWLDPDTWAKLDRVPATICVRARRGEGRTGLT